MQTTPIPTADQTGHPDTRREPSPQHRPKRHAPGRDDDNGREIDAPERPGRGKQDEACRPPNRR